MIKNDTMKAHIKTYGCTLNQADSRLIEAILKNSNVSIAQDISDADAVIINTCTVKKATEQKILAFIDRLEQGNTGKRIIVTGCMAGANKDIIRMRSANSLIVPINNIEAIAEAVKTGQNAGKIFHGIPSVRKNKERLEYFEPYKSAIAKIPVAEGCLSACNFCETRFARGPLKSFSEKLILNAIKKSIDFGAKEVQLTAQDIGCYGFDKKTNIVELLKKIGSIDGDFKLRLGMMNPEYLDKFAAGITSILNCGKFYKFLHVPIQSGSNRIIREMGRRYEIENIIQHIKNARKTIAGISIETDVIVGYPAETDADFEETLKAIKKIMPNAMNISKFAMRPHAKKWERMIDPEIVNERSRELSKIMRFYMYKNNKKYVNKIIDARITEKTEMSMNGRNEAYKQVIIKGANDDLIGSMQKVLVNFVTPTSLYGYLLNK